MSTNMGSKPVTPSVIARLMGLDELPTQQPVKKQKQQRVLSENYLKKVASIGVLEKQSVDGRHSFRFSTEEQKEFKYVNEELESFERDKESDLFTTMGRVGLGSPQEKVPFLSGGCIDWENTDIYEKVRSSADQGNAELLQKLDDCLAKDSGRKYGPDSTCMFPRFEPKDDRHASVRKIIVLKPKHGKAENTSDYLSSPSSSEASYSGHRNDKGFISHGKGNSHFLAEKEITRKTRHNTSDIAFDLPRSGFSGVQSLVNEPELMMVSSPSYYFDGSYVAKEAKKQISERWRMTKEFQDNGLTIGGRGRSRTLGEMLALPDYDKCANFPLPSGISSRDGWKNGGVGGLLKTRSLTYSASLDGPKTRSIHKAFHNGSDMTVTPKFSLNWSRLKSSNQDSHRKDGVEQQNPGSKGKKSQSSLYRESEKNLLLEDNHVTDVMLKNNVKKQDPSEENSVVSKPLNHDIVCSDSEDKTTPMDQWNEIKDENMSPEGYVVPDTAICRSASPSMSSDMMVVVENVAVGKDTGNHNQPEFELTGCTVSEKDYDSSSSVPDTLSQQEDLSIEISEECGTDPYSLLNSERAYQPSPVSVLEASFGEDISNSECTQNVSASLHDVRRQLEFLKSESNEEYSEGPGMVVSSDDDDDDDDACEESLEDCKVNEVLTKLFGVEESRDFSYMVDVLNEAGCHNRNQDLGFDGWHSPDSPLSPSVFETLEKKYGEQISWQRSARMLLFDRINLGLAELLRPCLGAPMWAKPVARRLSINQNSKKIEEELYALLVCQEKEARKNSSEKVLGNDDGWLFLGHDMEVIGREIENSLIDELVEEIVSLESF